jgi:cupin fold WbuC family metalloprotein
MIKIYSNIKKKILLHIIYKKNKTKTSRVNIAPENQFLQAADLRLKKNKTFKPHKHIWKKPKKKKIIAQESWLILKGKVKFFAYDTDGKFIKSYILRSGDLSMTFQGGHTYEALTDKTRVIEYKTGPYEGIEKDKVFI